MIVCAGEQKDVVRERDRRCHAHGQWLFARIGKHHEKFGSAEAKWRREVGLGCRAFAGLNEGVSPSVIAKVFRQPSWLRCLAREGKLTYGNHDFVPIAAHVVPAGWEHNDAGCGAEALAR